MNKSMSICISTLIAGFMAVTPLSGQNILEKKLPGFENNLQYRSGMCGNMGVLCGCVYVEDNANDANAGFNEVVIKGTTTVGIVLAKIVKENPKYQWTIDDGVINILPRKEYRYLVGGKDPLDVVIRNFEMRGEDTSAAEEKLYSATGLNPSSFIGAGPPAYYNTISMRLENATLREALNKIVKADGMAVWRLYFFHYNNSALLSFDSWRMDPSLSSKADSLRGENQRPFESELGGSVTRRYLIMVLALVAGLLLLVVGRKIARAKKLP